LVTGLRAALLLGTMLTLAAGCAGRRPPADSDYDGVPDRRDRCPLTPPRATVNGAGCPSDSDGDGVFDGMDRCPYTPGNARPVDSNGCPSDSDLDGVTDYLDRCSYTPSYARPVDSYGCPVDSDRDGVPDYLDRCPSTSAGIPVNAAGCPRDADGDGVLDIADRCPGTPPNARPVDATGCPRDADRDGVPDYIDRCPNTPPAKRRSVGADGCRTSVATNPSSTPTPSTVGAARPPPPVRAVRLSERPITVGPSRTGRGSSCALDVDVASAGGSLAVQVGSNVGVDLILPNGAPVSGSRTPVTSGGSIVTYRVTTAGRHRLQFTCTRGIPSVTLRAVPALQP
jgi:hypothetical protein